MNGKKRSKKEQDEPKEKKPKGKKQSEDDTEIDEEFIFKIDDDEDNLIEDDGIENVDEEEEEEEFLKEYDKSHKDATVVNVYAKIGKPKFKKYTEVKEDTIAGDYKDLICLLDQHNIIVHFQNDYPMREKYRFITEEIFKQDVEDFRKSSIHINFIYEDFHPEMVDDEEDELY